MRATEILVLLSTPLIVAAVVTATIFGLYAVGWTLSGFGYIQEKLLIFIWRKLRPNVARAN